MDRLQERAAERRRCQEDLEQGISAYANLTDGLIVWGIDARKQPPRGIDAACGLRLIPDPLAFESKLRDWIRDATNPPVMGVEYESCPGPAGGGFVVCLVPESGHKPHRAEWAGKHYYYRAGDDFFEADPAMLRLLFHPRYNPVFSINVTLEYFYRETPHELIVVMKMRANIENTGNESADDVYVLVSTNAYDILGRALPQPWLAAGDNWRLVRLDPNASMALAGIPLHRDFPFVFLRSYEWKSMPRDTGPVYTRKPPPAFDDIRFDFHVYSRNASMKSFAVTFTQDDLLNETTCTKICERLD